MQALSQSAEKISEVQGGSIVSPIGFKTAGVHAGLRYSKKDLGVIYSEKPAHAAAVYTTSMVQAAPLHVTKDSIAAEGLIQAVVVNSACANACTGERGYQDALQMREYGAKHLGIPSQYVAVASTGVIGEFLQMDKIEQGIKQLAPDSSSRSAEDFQTAILTTDTVQKSCCYTTMIDGKTISMGGAAKGSGMIHPNMATMLAFVTTDAEVDSDSLQEALKEITNHSFNQITVDGDTSTNDMVLVMANGNAENSPLSPQHPEWQAFVQLLSMTCKNLAKQIARDGEGATKLIEVEVTGAVNDTDAKKAAKQIVGSNLVKTAMFGADANWGRIIGALGQSGVSIDNSMVDITIGDIQMLQKSEPQPFSEEEATGYLKNKEVKITVNLHQGTGQGKAWGCDLSYDYVKINASYRT
ncbi:bifunctional ornithine acetyltransferase/N-acetylglutamate synthase [Bacillus mesophilum]|uniref:Arginine biosynthesis bifunctional protein ArgJ n=1 Tax=Bacillus mesophilum TaxID=1071718 RepID=A0A7V7UU65_9BACI|nr:bifunctional ornithine acetyltransferase/N-acetylglutamate synthase [Bacillus mesophilum]KAB2330886.1 bifunctional ornithine acetyltransferase/N-acetylglutamate synthase [Bacillus mesophilum]